MCWLRECAESFLTVIATALRRYADRVRVYFDDECVADHRRLFGCDQTVFDPWHYLPVLQRKPGALRNGAPFKDWALPVSIKRTWERLKSYRDWDRQSVDILSMVAPSAWRTPSTTGARRMAIFTATTSTGKTTLERNRRSSDGKLQTPRRPTAARGLQAPP